MTAVAAVPAAGPFWVSVARRHWSHRRAVLLTALIVLMAFLGTAKLGDELLRLTVRTGRIGDAIDLRLRHAETANWFSTPTTSPRRDRAVYPPASYVMFWPLLGWLPIPAARWLWAVVSVAALAWLAVLFLRHSLARDHREQLVAALMPLSMNATGVTIGNGQLPLFQIPLLIAGTLLVASSRRAWRTDLLAAALFVLALVKPNVSLPFFWLLLLLPARPRPALLAALGYALLTLFALTYHSDDFRATLERRVDRVTAVSERRGPVSAVTNEYTSMVYGGYGNLHTWLIKVRLAPLAPVAAVVSMLVLGAWLFRERHADVWLLMGVTAIVARLFTYHWLYDDMLILISMLALFRIAVAGQAADGRDLLAGALLGATILGMMLPAKTEFLPFPWHLPFTAGHPLLWIAALVLLVDQVRRERRQREFTLGTPASYSTAQ